MFSLAARHPSPRTRIASFIPRLPHAIGSRLTAGIQGFIQANPTKALLLERHMIVEIPRAVRTYFFALVVLHIFCISAKNAFWFVLFEDDAILVHQYLHRSVAPDAHSPAQVFGQHDPAQHVQPSYNPYRLHNLSPSLNFDMIRHYCIIPCIDLLEEERKIFKIQFYQMTMVFWLAPRSLVP
jgi:hypothetical protein